MIPNMSSKKLDICKQQVIKFSNTKSLHKILSIALKYFTSALHDMYTDFLQ